jgi:signal transduction histidine kinase
MRELGYTIKSTTKVNILDFLSSDDKLLLLELLDKKFYDKKTLEVKVKHANGTFRIYEFVITNLLSEPSINGYVINARDITNQIKARNEIDIALAKEQELNRLKTQFIATVSHEFRTPLTNISLNIQLLEKYLHDQNFENSESSLNRMSNAVKRLVALLNEVSLISKDQSGRLQFLPSEVDIYDLFDELIDQQSYLILPYVEVKVKKGKRQNVHVDKNLLQHIIGNLISNAVKYSPQKTPITVTILNKRTSILMKVKDMGIGIPAEEFQYLFDPYFRASNVSQIAGTGLGLSIVKKCVELHNGTVEVISEPTMGTEITCTIPLNFNE